MVRLFWLSLLGVMIATTTALADRHYVRFDVGQTVTAEDISSAEFLAKNPTEKLVRIRIPISALMQLHSDDSLLQFLYLISGSTTSQFQIVDYAPKTTLSTDVHGFISKENAEDRSSTLGIHVLSPHDIPAKADATAEHNVGSRKSQRLELLPPKHLLSASGTMHRGVSAYFKLKPSTQTTLEGSKTFEVVARVNRNWRASLLYVNCTAVGKSRGLNDKANAVCAQSGFVVGAYLAGDEVAKKSVQQLAMTQHQLKQLASKHAKSIEEQRFPSVGHKLGAALFVVKPRIPDQWLNELLTSGDFHGFERHLPRNIRNAATDYRQARAQVIQFAG